MDKVRSWDKTYHETDTHRGGITTDAARCNGPKDRVVAWPEGAPDPSTVPHANDKVSCGVNDTVLTVRHGIPEHIGGYWQLRMTDGVAYTIRSLHRISDFPTISVGGKKYLESDVVERCSPLVEYS